MKCRVVRVGDTAAIVCGSAPRAKKCACGRPATILCDYPVNGGTCDRACCTFHRVNVGPDRDYCLEHARRRPA